MIYRNIPGTDMNVSVIGYGGWGAGIKGWRNVSEKKVRESIIAAYKSGINFFDTAPIYGNGKSEEILGEELSSFRNTVFIASKCGLIQNENGVVEHCLKPESIFREIESTLKRLKTDYIDLYQIHFPDNKTPLETVFNMMNRLKREKMIRYFGVSNFSLKLLHETRNAGYVSVQNRFNIFQHEEARNILDYCKNENVGFIAYSPLCQGIFSDSVDEKFKPSNRDVRHLNPIFTDKKLFDNALYQKSKIKNPLHEALSFVINTPGVTTSLVTMTRPEHVKENAALTEYR
ncbi:MAG: aldo/keto reductase [Spirochaetales bacterium]|nr:aldo/keto reductase [Spirochaetales bacterium]